MTRTIVKKYNAEIHSQASIEGILELQADYGFTGVDVERVGIETFDVAYNIIGGGEEGDKTIVRTKEEADHSLQYMVAVAVLDGQVMPPQYVPGRIQREDVQVLLRKVIVRPSEEFSRIFPQEMPCRLTVTLSDGRILTKEKRDYEGFFTRPMTWQTVVQKFERLATPYTDDSLRAQIADAVGKLETIQIADLTALLAKVRTP